MDVFTLKVQKPGDIKNRIDSLVLAQMSTGTPVFEGDIDLLDIYDEGMKHKGTYKLTVGYLKQSEPCQGHEGVNIGYFSFYWGVYLITADGNVTTIFENKNYAYGFCEDPENCNISQQHKQLTDISALISNEVIDSISSIINDYNAKVLITDVRGILKEAEKEKQKYGTISFETFEQLYTKIDELELTKQNLHEHTKEHKLICFMISKANKLME